jgi:hypothetical protein
MRGKMIVDMIRPGRSVCEATGLLWPSVALPELNYHNPAFENYDYIFLNDSELETTKDETTVNTPAYSGSTSRTIGKNSVPRPAPQPWDNIVPVIDDTDPAMIRRARFSRSVNWRRKALLGTTQITEHQLLLMPFYVPAFSLSTKKWCMYFLN